MNAEDFHRMRKYVATPFGRIAYVECGSGPAAIFVHGFPLNGFFWRDVIDDLAGVRRCIAPDMMGFGHSDVSGEQDLSFKSQARMIAALMDALRLDKADLIGNDTGGGVSQIFAATNPARVRTLTLTNCEVHNLWPNRTLQQLFDALCQEGALANMKVMATDPAAARGAFATAYEDAARIPEEAFRTYLEPVLSTTQRAEALRRFLFAAESDVEQLVAIAPQLKHLQAPVQVIWGDADVFFDMEPSLNWLRQNVPAIRKVITVPRAKLFFPEEHPKLMSVLLGEFWRSAA